MMEPAAVRDLAREMLDALDRAALVTPPSRRFAGLTFSDAYRVAAEAARTRAARGERAIGRKIGYTNRSIWPRYHMDQPIWDHVYAHTVQHASNHSTVQSLVGMVAPRIEPEIVFVLSGPVEPSDDPARVLSAVRQVARAFEIVDCHYAGWSFSAPDSVIDFSHHAALIVGEPMEIAPSDREHVADALGSCRVSLVREGELVASGTGANALGHPALALAHLASLLAVQSDAPPLAAGEIVTTGTLTDLQPVHAGETWRSETDGLPLPTLEVRFV